jgi:hypothetical protein
MTPTVILNLIVSIVAIGGVAAFMRAAHLAAHEKPADPRDARYELADQLDRAA